MLLEYHIEKILRIKKFVNLKNVMNLLKPLTNIVPGRIVELGCVDLEWQNHSELPQSP